MGDAATALEQHESFIQSNTYFGTLLEPVYKLRQQAKDYVQVKKVERKQVTYVDPLAAMGF